ncbi:MAG: hypothetical protein P9M03_06395 [Candidatus Theseobacter exili]|nr:hypothetical protein [Candidatus Theseobacter exili]
MIKTIISKIKKSLFKCETAPSQSQTNDSSEKLDKSSYPELLDKLSKIHFEEKRNDSPHLYEFVIIKEQLDQVKSCMESFFGPAIKIENQNPSRQTTDLTKSHGGIRKEQSCYFLNYDGNEYLALFWPWSDGKRITVKLIVTE